MRHIKTITTMGEEQVNYAWLEGVVSPAYRNMIAEQLHEQGDYQFPINNRETLVSMIELSPLLTEMIARHGKDIGLKFGLSIGASAHGAMGFAAVSAGDAAAVLSMIHRYAHIRNRCFNYLLEDSDNGLTLALAHRVDLGEFTLFIEQATLLTFIRLLQTALGGGELELEVFVSWSESTGTQLSQLPGNVRLHYNASCSAIRLPRELLRQTCLLADPALHRAAIATCEQEALLQAGGYAPRVRQHLGDPESGWNSLSEIANILGQSKRTLMRHLRTENTSYRQILDEQRFELARYYLLFSSMSVADIATAVGYQDASNFSRTFKRWVGMVPGEFRRQNIVDSTKLGELPDC